MKKSGHDRHSSVKISPHHIAISVALKYFGKSKNLKLNIHLKNDLIQCGKSRTNSILFNISLGKNCFRNCLEKFLSFVGIIIFS